MMINVYIPFIGRLIHNSKLDALADKAEENGLYGMANDIRSRRGTYGFVIIPLTTNYWLIRRA